MIKTLPNNPGLVTLADMIPDITFAAPGGRPLKLQLLKPRFATGAPFPLIVFIQGSGWTNPNPYWQIPQLSEFARRGYVVASVTHRSCFEARSPAFLKDAKSALRFLRAHAAEYSIDPTRVCAWGTSSGGNTALLMGLTGGDASLEEGDYLEQSSAVQAVVDCFGPTDLVRMVLEQYKDVPDTADTVMHGLCGGSVLENLEALRRISPQYLITDAPTPPFLLLHGDADPVVLFEHTEAFYNALLAKGRDVEMYRVPGAPHEGSFWSAALLETIYGFVSAKL